MENKIEKMIEDRKDIINDGYKNKIKRASLDEIKLQRNIYQEVVVKEIIEETKDTKSFILSSLDKKSLIPFYPGQYICVYLSIDNKSQARAYSLSSTPNDALKGKYRITIKRVVNGLVSNYMLDKLRVGTHLTISKPSGNFYYHNLRDELNVIAIAGGSGITPFISMAKSIEENYDSYHLTVFYSVKRESDIIFKEEIERINSKSSKVKFVITLTKEENKNYLHGRINENMLKDYMEEFNTVFMCGPKELYRSMNEVLNEFNLPTRSVYYENFFMPYIPVEKETYNLKILSREEQINIKCHSDETLMASMEKEGIKAPSLCTVGGCGFCRSILVDGNVKMIGGNLKKAEIENSYIHPCVSYPESDITIKLDL